GHQGIAWGWYLISPEWDGIFDSNAKPLPYNEPDTTKAMIIMTDGEFNNHLYGSQGNSTEQARALCDSIKEKGVVIFTIAFQAPESGEDVLSYCASSTEHAFKASNGAELKASYQSIATSISDLRIKS
ncbi:MAG TPA: VWA domain-containing protein, partial [Henriciella marina]|uniref:VWA domain-containing protein n=1 Tax=Henriciella sp. TaxID=1968823 RepID=UPI001A1C76B8